MSASYRVSQCHWTTQTRHILQSPTLRSSSIQSKHHHHRTYSTPLRNSDGSDTLYGFQINERYLEWDDSATRQLLRIHVAEKLNVSIEYVNEKLHELSILLPDLVNKLETMKASLLLSLIQDTDAVARRMLDLRDVLPNMNVSLMVAGNVWLLQGPSKEILEKNIQTLREALPDIQLEPLLESEPRLLVCDIYKVLDELKRLLPGADSKKIIATHAGMVLGMEDAGLPASLEIDDGIKAP